MDRQAKNSLTSKDFSETHGHFSLKMMQQNQPRISKIQSNTHVAELFNSSFLQTLLKVKGKPLHSKHSLEGNVPLISKSTMDCWAAENPTQHSACRSFQMMAFSWWRNMTHFWWNKKSEIGTKTLSLFTTILYEAKAEMLFDGCCFFYFFKN